MGALREGATVRASCETVSGPASGPQSTRKCRTLWDEPEQAATMATQNRLLSFTLKS